VSSTRVHVEDRGAGIFVRGWGAEPSPDVVVTLDYTPGDGAEALRLLDAAVARVRRDVERTP
jgi:hypothetical protein